MHTTEVEEKAKRLGDILQRADTATDDEQKEAVQLGLDLFQGVCLNLARIADALDHGVVKVETVTTNR